MNNDPERFHSLPDVIKRAKDFFKYCRKKLWLGCIFLLIGVIVGYFYYYGQKSRYEAQCTFVVEEKQSSLGGLGTIASQFGFDIGNLSGGESIFAGDNILDILKSRKIVQQVLLSQLDDTYLGRTTLADIYLEFSGLKNKWAGIKKLEAINFSKIGVTNDRIHDSVLNIVYEKILKKSLSADRINKKGTIIRVQVTAQSSIFAKLMTERLVDEASKMYLNIKTGTAQANINRMQHRADSLLALLNRKSYSAAMIQPLDINPGIKSAIVPTEIATRDKTVIATVYTEVTKNLEASKLLLSQQTPVIQVLDKPGLSLYDNKKSLLYSIIVSTSLFCLFFCFFIILSFALNPLFQKNKVQFDEGHLK